MKAWLFGSFGLFALVLVAVFSPDRAFAEQAGQAVPGAGDRLALVIGNGAYAAGSELPNPTNDATDVSAALGRLGFDVTTKLNLDRVGMDEALQTFARRSRGADMALVFYAGHGMEMDGQNYLVPVDARLESETDVEKRTVPLDRVLRATEDAGLRVVILDACRDMPPEWEIRRVRARSISRGAFGDIHVQGLDETLVAYAAAAGTTAADGSGRNSPYTAALLEYLEEPLTITALFQRVRRHVLTSTAGRQRPHEYQSLLRDHYLSAAGDMGGADPDPVPPPTMPRGYAVVVGVGEYRNLDESRQLLYSQSDAEAMYRVLISPEGGAFSAENVRLLTGSQATLANIRQAVEEWLPSVATPADRVIVYFAGHGLVEGGRGYLAPWDLDPDRVAATAYPMATLGEVMSNRVPARWKVLLTDACHSGKINFNAETTNEALDLQFSSLPQNFLTLTATREREQSYEDPDLSTGYGFFTYFLTQAWLGHADNDPCDGRITADEVIEYVRTNVRRYARSRSLSQTPTARGDYDPAMLLGVGTACLGDVDAQSPSLLGTAIVEVNLDDVDLYIDGQLVGSISRGRPLRIPGLSSGMHEFMGVRDGYEPYARQIMIAPGQEVAVRLRIRYVRRIRPSALDFGARGERLLFTQRSSLNPMNVLPVSRSQRRRDLEDARNLFMAALDEDSGYSRAAWCLGQTHHLLGDLRASIEAYRSALRIDPSYVDARVHLAGVLVESGDPDAAVRELTDAARIEPTDELYAMLARAYGDLGAWEQSAGAAREAISLNGSNAQAHLWRADALRHLAADGDGPVTDRSALYREAREGYRRFLALTNFESSFAEKLGFVFGVSRRSHADREGAWRKLRTAGYLGLCITENRTYNPLRAREYCRRAVDYDERNPIAHFLLGNVNRDLFNLYQTCGYLSAAAGSYSRMLEINGYLAESDNARNYREQITGISRQLGC